MNSVLITRFSAVGNGFFFLGNFHFRGNRFLENLGESGLGKFFSSENLGETLQGKFTKNGKLRGNQLGEFF